MILSLAALTVVALRRRPVAEFLGASFFIILAPSSSIVPIVTQTVAEHRMYLPLALVVAGAVASVFAHCRSRRLAGAAFAAILVALFGATVARNRVYATEMSLWTDNLQKKPGSYRSLVNLGLAYERVADWQNVADYFTRAVAVDGSDGSVNYALGKR